MGQTTASGILQEGGELLSYFGILPRKPRDCSGLNRVLNQALLFSKPISFTRELLTSLLPKLFFSFPL